MKTNPFDKTGVGKYNYKTKEYDSYLPPDNAVTYMTDMEAIIDCAECGEKVVAGDTYTSFVIHREPGWGYMVCKDCYDHEWKERRKHEEI